MTSQHRAPRPLGHDVADEDVRREAREWLDHELGGEFRDLVGRGGAGKEDESLDRRRDWERRLGEGGWIGLGWPVADGGRGATLGQQVIFHEEYARAGGPGRLGHIGEQLLGPTLLAFGTADQRQRFLPGILAGTTLWCQGYSEPGAGSDLAGVRTSARRDGDDYVITGQKVWTSLAHLADWCFAVVRTDPNSVRHHGLSYLLVPMDQPGIDVRPIPQITRRSEFNEVFFDGARTPTTNLVGEEGQGWKVAMGTLGFERGVSTLGQQIGFGRELAGVIAVARDNGAAQDPEIAERLTRAWVGLQVLRHLAVSTLRSSAELSGFEASASKLQWAGWHRALGELAIDVLGTDGLTVDGATYGLSPQQTAFLFSRADTIYGGSDEIQRNIISERVLGLPRG
ncbi:alkylation response protein AidB-like acyl-CoA dehydrogenase [Branchiibius hedensis]|uniref:Acyl-CoA dehydrogenase n=1 Tax=Branchiibius hedensis TaxID=672460 RepID=A0A2Y8ZX37_9MICO|nr:acyl-CoA dehydrogenase family protein [Branchiibius hedensis]PWJ27047.1 alkylation response protein AidB-like acyl-CoA dehydrogenase [Branchiibius hedensis]SSA35858.1 Acyl-CoA dehydrogenase [Branchiibius hedensis]